MRFLLLLPAFLCCAPAIAGVAAPACPPSCVAPAVHARACPPLRAAQGEPDGWILLAGLVVCTAGRLAGHRRR